MQGLDDTIAAIATAPGAAGLAVVRLSGASALAAADSVFRGGVQLAAAPSHTLHHGWVVRPEPASAAADRQVSGCIDAVGPPGRIDEVVAAIFRAPRSYTREDVVEFSCHGGGSAAQLLHALLATGARLAQPGEFTLRAFLNGRMDLMQAEAVADLIHAETEGARELALGQLAGELSRRLALVRVAIEDLLAEVEARVDFAEDVGGIEIPPHAVAAMVTADAALVELLDGAAFGRAVREGLRIPLIGTPNAGKSSLFNALVGEERAIVTPEPGTTRDRVSESIEVSGIRVVLSDTAGLRDPGGMIEALGVARSLAALEESPLVVWVVDAARALGAEERALGARLAAEPAPPAPGSNRMASPLTRRVLVALNKSDLAPRVSEDEVTCLLGGSGHRVVRVSALTRMGIAALLDALAAMAAGDAGSMGIGLSNARHIEALGRARAALGRAAVAGQAGEPGEIVALELRESLGAIGEVTGHAVAEDLLDRIFARFCVGK